METFDANSLISISDSIIEIEPKLKQVVTDYGYPPLWYREPTFETLILTILEQQVSLASARSAFEKLKTKIITFSPENVLSLSDEELRSSGFSRQKIKYAKGLATEIINGNLNLDKLKNHSDDLIRSELIKIKGIGDWTIDMFLIMSLHRTDIFPVGDLATVKSMKELKLVNPESSKEQLIKYIERFKPYRSIASYLLWHSYIQKRKLVLK